MPFKRLQARGVPLLRPFKKFGLTGMRLGSRWVFRAVFSNTAVIRHICKSGALTGAILA